MEPKHKLNWDLWDWEGKKGLSAPRWGESDHERGKSRPHAVSMYPLSPSARTKANSKHNRLFQSLQPEVPTSHQRAEVTSAWSLHGGCCCRHPRETSLVQSLSAHCVSTLLLPRFPCSQHTCSAETTHRQKILQCKGAHPYTPSVRASRLSALL